MAEDGNMESPLDIRNYHRNPIDSAPVFFTAVWARTSDSTNVREIAVGTEFLVCVGLTALREIHGANLSVILKDTRGQRVATFFSWDQDFSLNLSRGRHVVEMKIRNLALAPSLYYVDLGVNQSTATQAFDVVLDYPLIRVVNRALIVHWTERPWGVIHPTDVGWRLIPPVEE